MIEANSNVNNNISYYNIGKSNNPAEWTVSHSSLNKLDPTLGGHPKIFFKSMMEDQGVTTASMENGNLLHDWIERKDQFIVEEQDKPTDKLAEIAKNFYELYIKEGYKTDSMFASFCTQSYKIEIEDLQKYREMFINLHQRPPMEDEIKLLIYAFRFSRLAAAYNKGLKEGTVLDQFRPLGLPYVSFLKKANGKIILKSADRDTLFNCHESLRRHPLAYDLLFEQQGEHEVELFWQEEVDGININRKAKLDKVIADFDKKIIIIPDLKTTSFPVSLFATGENCSYKKYNYGGQLSSYAVGWARANKILETFHEWDVRLYNIVVQTNSEFPVMGYKLSKQVMQQKLWNLEILTERLAFHIKTNNWDLTKEEIDNGAIEINT